MIAANSGRDRRERAAEDPPMRQSGTPPVREPARYAFRQPDPHSPLALAMTSSVKAEPIAFDEVPVIDVGRLRDGSDPSGVGAELAQAASEVGFLYVRNHGVDTATIESARRAGFELFRLPAEAKWEARTNRYHHGWLGPDATKMYDDALPDLKESFNWGVEPEVEGGAGTGAESPNPLAGPNVWPPALPALEPGLAPWFEAASACAEDLLRGFALGAGLDPEHFIRLRDRPLSRGSLQYYPPHPADVGDDRFGVAPHTDFGMLTVLAQDDVGGLEIQRLDGGWVAMPPVPGTLVVNVGDLLERWSNGQFHSTVHRVINRSGRERLSLVLAYDPNFETTVDPGAFCAGGEALRDEPILCGDYLLWRFEKAFAYRR